MKSLIEKKEVQIAPTIHDKFLENIILRETLKHPTLPTYIHVFKQDIAYHIISIFHI